MKKYGQILYLIDYIAYGLHLCCKTPIRNGDDLFQRCWFCRMPISGKGLGSGVWVKCRERGLGK